jgi:serine/threonine protein kinase
LADHFHGDRKNPQGLSWDTRLNIAIQTTEALAFLHNIDPPIFHRDVKTSNILLDDNFNVKMADFRLCRHMPVNASHVTTTPQGKPTLGSKLYFFSIYNNYESEPCLFHQHSATTVTILFSIFTPLMNLFQLMCEIPPKKFCK